MAYEINWLQDRRVIHMRVMDELTIDDMRRFSHELVACLNQGQAPVHIIGDITGLRKFPSNITAMKNAVPHIRHPNLGWNIVVGGPYLLETIAQIIARVAGVHYHVARSPEQALEFLYAQDETLEPRRE